VASLINNVANLHATDLVVIAFIRWPTSILNLISIIIIIIIYLKRFRHRSKTTKLLFDLPFAAPDSVLMCVPKSVSNLVPALNACPSVWNRNSWL